jgi:hypothetical protein
MASFRIVRLGLIDPDCREHSAQSRAAAGVVNARCPLSSASSSMRAAVAVRVVVAPRDAPGSAIGSRSVVVAPAGAGPIRGAHAG